MNNSLDNVFQGIYKSIVEAQNTVEQHTVGEIKKDYFEPVTKESVHSFLELSN